jgi:hypothetical protein
MTVVPTIQYGLKWQFSVVALGVGTGPMTVPEQQVLTVSQATAYSGSPPGVIAITSTGSYPTTGNMSTALSAAATAAGLILNANPALTQWQGFATGGG